MRNVCISLKLFLLFKMWLPKNVKSHMARAPGLHFVPVGLDCSRPTEFTFGEEGHAVSSRGLPMYAPRPSKGGDFQSHGLEKSSPQRAQEQGSPGLLCSPLPPTLPLHYPPHNTSPSCLLHRLAQAARGPAPHTLCSDSGLRALHNRTYPQIMSSVLFLPLSSGKH